MKVCTHTSSTQIVFEEFEFIVILRVFEGKHYLDTAYTSGESSSLIIGTGCSTGLSRLVALIGCDLCAKPGLPGCNCKNIRNG